MIVTVSLIGQSNPQFHRLPESGLAKTTVYIGKMVVSERHWDLCIEGVSREG